MSGHPQVHNWDLYKIQIENLYLVHNLTLTKVIQSMHNDYGFKASRSQYNRKFQAWGIKKRKSFLNNPHLLEIIKDLWSRNFNSTSMLHALNNYKGYPDLTHRSLKDIRLKNNLRFRNRKLSDQLLAARTALTLINRQIESGQGLRYGIVYSHTNIRSISDIFIPREHIQHALQAVNPDGIEARKRKQHRRRGRYQVKGPSRVWSVDGHDKLSEFGFEIYGIIDAYSRYIIDIYIGISNRTAVSVQQRYIYAVEKYGFPKVIRSDKGSETGLMAECQVKFRRHEDPSLPFQKCYLYGTSTRNQRIEAWWNTMSTGQSETWKKHFEILRNQGLFDGSFIDITALRYIYMPILRKHIATFVELHNNHKIRGQKARDMYLPTGKPYEMFHFPKTNIQSYASKPNALLLQQFKFETRNWNGDEYQHQETASLCKLLLERENFPTNFEFSYGAEDLHLRAYRYLRNALHNHHQAGNEIQSLLLPIGARRWINEQQTQNLEAAIAEHDIQTEDGYISEEYIESEHEIEDANDDDDGIVMYIN